MKKFATAAGVAPVLHRNSANLMQSMLDEVKSSITILPELQALIPALQGGELEQLEANIRHDGCREALLIWQTTQRIVDGSENDAPLNILVDGHNRYAICSRNNIDFKVMLRDFPSMQTVRDFMIDNQLGRRNLTPEQMSYLRGLKYRNERQAAGRPAQESSSPKQDDNETKLAQRTQDRLAKAFNVSPRTIHRDREYSEGIDKLVPDLKQQVLNGKQKVAKELIREIGRTISTDGAPLSLPDLLAYNTAPADTTSQLAPSQNAGFTLVKEIASRSAALTITSPTFQKDCDELISLLTKAKQISA